MKSFTKFAFALAAVCLITALLGFTRAVEPATHIRCGENLTENTLLDTDLIDCERDDLITRAQGSIL